MRLDISATAARGRQASPSVGRDATAGRRRQRRISRGSRRPARESRRRSCWMVGPRLGTELLLTVGRVSVAESRLLQHGGWRLHSAAKLPATLAGFQWETIFIRSPTESEQLVTFLEIVRARLTTRTSRGSLGGTRESGIVARVKRRVVVRLW